MKRVTMKTAKALALSLVVPALLAPGMGSAFPTDTDTYQINAGRVASIEFNDPAVPHGLIMSKKSLALSEQEKWRVLVNGMRTDGTMRRIFEKSGYVQHTSYDSGVISLEFRFDEVAPSVPHLPDDE